MKKVLLTSTALVAFAGYAAAEVAVSGSAEMGVVGGEDQATQFFQDIDVTFTMTGETDGGLSFGAAVDLDEASDDNGTIEDAMGNPFEDGGVAIFISGDFGTVTMGDTDGALDWALQEANIGSPGSIRDDETTHPGYFGSYHDGAGAYDGQIVRYDYTFGDFGVAVSVEQAGDGTGDVDGVANGKQAEDLGAGFAIGFRYNTDFGGAAVGVGLGYQVVAEDVLAPGSEQAEILGLSGSVTSGGISAALQFTSGDIGGIEDSTHVGIGASYTFDMFTIHANYGKFDFGNDTSSEGFGIAAGYDLGGGASILFGYGDGQLEDAAGNTTEVDGTYSLGLSFSF